MDRTSQSGGSGPWSLVLSVSGLVLGMLIPGWLVLNSGGCITAVGSSYGSGYSIRLGQIRKAVKMTRALADAAGSSPGASKAEQAAKEAEAAEKSARDYGRAHPRSARCQEIADDAYKKVQQQFLIAVNACPETASILGLFDPHVGGVFAQSDAGVDRGGGFQQVSEEEEDPDLLSVEDALPGGDVPDYVPPPE